ncbi:MAG: hypothetical protein LUE86_10895 [Clostridiales bacterium]|nr:hypothetical protein [Clostridiales bacterium]
MKKAKKCLLAAGTLAILAAMPITAYAFSFGWKTTKTETSDTEEAAYVFEAGETRISMGAEAAPVIEALGTPEKTFEQDSCAYQGKDTVYTYQGFELSTYPVKGKDHIASVYFLDDTVSTPEGIRIGSKKQDIINSYGNDYVEEFGVYRYRAGDTELVIYTTGGVVDAVEYLVRTE